MHSRDEAYRRFFERSLGPDAYQQSSPPARQPQAPPLALSITTFSGNYYHFGDVSEATALKIVRSKAHRPPGR